MAGLNLHLGAGAQVGAGSPGYVDGSYPKPSTAGQAGFGPGYTANAMPSTSGALAPNDPFGLALWVGVGALALLVFIRYSLPA